MLRLQIYKITKTNPDDTWPTGAHSGVVKNKLTFLPYEKRKHYPAKFDVEKPKEKVTFDAVRKNPSRAAEFVAQMSPRTCPHQRLCLGRVGEWKVSVRQVVCFRQKV